MVLRNIYLRIANMYGTDHIINVTGLDFTIAIKISRILRNTSMK